MEDVSLHRPGSELSVSDGESRAREGTLKRFSGTAARRVSAFTGPRQSRPSGGPRLPTPDAIVPPPGAGAPVLGSAGPGLSVLEMKEMQPRKGKENISK